MKSEVRSPKSRDLKALVCFALEEEAAPFRKLASGNAGVSILTTGIGRRNAETAVDEVLGEAGSRLRETADPAADRSLMSAATLFTCGFAGGLNPDLAVGNVVFETSDPTLRENLARVGVKPAKFFCASRVAVTAAEKAELRRTTGADAVEMESAAIRALCRERGIPCATVRVISDTANEDLPLDFNQLAKPDLSLDYGKLAWAIICSPWKIPALLRLQSNTKLAARRLAAVLERVLWPS